MEALTAETLPAVLSPRERPSVVLFWTAGCSLCVAAKEALASLDLKSACDVYAYEMIVPSDWTEVQRLGMTAWPVVAVYTRKGQPCAAVSSITDADAIDGMIRHALAESTTTSPWGRYRQAMSVIKVALRSFFSILLGQKPFVPLAARQRRVDICQPCHNRVETTCGVCGCQLGLKQAVRASSCPKGLW